MEKEQLNELADGGKKEVKEISIKKGEKVYNAVFVMDFALLRKAFAALVNTNVSGKGKDAKVDVKMDILGAGDKVLFFGWHSGHEEMKTKFALRRKACSILGAWVQELMDDEEIDEEIDEEEEKKS